MWTRIVLLLCLAFGGWQSASAGVVRIADGDCAGLANAVNVTAQIGGSTTILLARAGTYSGCGINMNAGDVTIDGQGSHMQFFSACIGSPNLPAPGASLLIRNLSIGAPATSTTIVPVCEVDTGDIGISQFSFGIINTGSLALESVTLQGLPIPPSFYYVAYIASYGNLVLRNVTAENIAASFVGSTGKAEIYNSTLVGASLIPYLYGGGEASQFVIANSVFVSATNPVCRQNGSNKNYQSLGGNVATESSCGFSAATGDKIVSDASLNTFGDHGGLIPTRAINSGSPAKSAGVAQYCEALDARGYTRSPHGCDAGAYEYGGGSGALTASGLNGFYYDPDANGHYVSLQRIHDNGDIAIVWSTFDASGNPAWVYGVGQLTGQRIHATMSQNLGGVLQPGGAPTGSSVHPWGTVDIDLTSCALAQFSYASNVPGFGSGAFPLTRLAFVSDFGCSDQGATP